MLKVLTVSQFPCSKLLSLHSSYPQSYLLSLTVAVMILGQKSKLCAPKKGHQVQGEIQGPKDAQATL